MANKPKNNSDHNNNTDIEASRNLSKTEDYKGEAQNVNDDTDRPLTDKEAAKGSRKANEHND